MHIKHSQRILSAFVPKLARRTSRHASGQAIVELTLALTFLTFLFAAAVDLGLAFKSYQTLINASAEASGYLKIRPVVGCDPNASKCDPDPNLAIYRADKEARVRFRGEQGDKMGGFGNTLDLNADGKDDNTQYGETWFADWIKIDAADESQLNATQSDFAVGSTFEPTATHPSCIARNGIYTITNSAGLKEARQCFLVVRTKIIYKPFAIAPAVGKEMTIRALSVVPITSN